MEEKKKRTGRPTIYTGGENGFVRRGQAGVPQREQSQRTEQAGIPQRGQSHRTGQAGIPQRKQDQEPGPEKPPGKRYREVETESRMRMLWSILGVLTAVLIAAIIYEIVLGYGIRETGSERMEKMRQEKLLKTSEEMAVSGTEPAAGENEAGETGRGTEPESGTAETEETNSGIAETEGTNSGTEAAPVAGEL